MTRLVVLTACKDAQFAIKGLLSRSPLALGFVPPTMNEIAWPVDAEGKDSGVLRNAEDLVRLYAKTEAKALVVFDHEGSNAKLTAPAAEKAMAEVGKARSSSVFRQLGEKVSFATCRDRACLRLIQALRGWFPPG